MLMRSEKWALLAILLCSTGSPFAVSAQSAPQQPSEPTSTHTPPAVPSSSSPAVPPMIGPSLTVPGIAPGEAMKLVAYGDSRFTDTGNVSDTNPKNRQCLVFIIFAAQPLGVFAPRE